MSTASKQNNTNRDKKKTSGFATSHIRLLDFFENIEIRRDQHFSKIIIKYSIYE